MLQRTSPQWNQLYDLALVYVALTHSTNQDEASTETVSVLESIMHHVPQASTEEVEAAIDKSLYAYLSVSGEQMLEIAVVSLRKHFELDQRMAILDDLASLATANGNLVPAEATFLQQLAKHWEVEQERSR